MNTPLKHRAQTPIGESDRKDTAALRALMARRRLRLVTRARVVAARTSSTPR